ncbi:ester cyclase [Amycolatopsis sp. lyj-90]|uniref:ester cyclase n=1 Tax=Amycolatopsis sp. lyj-90 TaxID=2789285 RepID=UPI0039795861
MAGEFAKLAESWVAIWNGDLALTETTVPEDFTWHAAPLDGGPVRATVGRENLKTWVGGLRAAFPDLLFTVHIGPIVDGDVLVLRWLAEGTYRGGFPGADEEQVGRRVSFHGTDILRVADGLIAEYWINADILWLFEQLGVRELPVRTP